MSEVAAIRRNGTIVDPDLDSVVAAAQVKAVGGFAYADAFCIATAQRLDVPVWTGDPEIIEAVSALPCDVVDLR